MKQCTPSLKKLTYLIRNDVIDENPELELATKLVRHTGFPLLEKLDEMIDTKIS